jgi:UDP-N-acetylglucosamine transferase subunit ALG13
VIFVTVGTNEAPFDRLLHWLDRLQPAEELVVQHGASAVRPVNAACLEFLPFEELVDYVRKARVVVTHAGVGSIMVALAEGKRPVVVPRLRRHGEAVDDHQVDLAERLAGAGLVVPVSSPEALSDALIRDTAPPPEEFRPSAPLVRELRDYLAGVAGTPAG